MPTPSPARRCKCTSPYTALSGDPHYRVCCPFCHKEHFSLACPHEGCRCPHCGSQWTVGPRVEQELANGGD